MSRPFTHYTAKPTFKQISEPLNASDYVVKKKLKYSFCAPNICHPNKNINTFEKYYGLTGVECNLDDLGEEFGCTKERIRQLRDKAIKKLRNESFGLLNYL